MSKLTIPLYHGTDRKVFAMSPEERTEAKKSAFALINYFSKVYVQNKFEFKDFRESAIPEHDKHIEFLKDKLKDCYAHTYHCYGMCTSYMKSSNYQYDSFYVTGIYNRACDFAKKATHFGEIGDTAYTLWNGANLLGYEIDNLEIQDDLLILNKIWSLPSSPVLIKFDGLVREQLLLESGAEIESNMDENFFKGCNFRLRNDFTSYSNYSLLELYGK
ncbi:MAG: hypothetical protein K6C97_08390 [Treponema sp.]|nr:hypothetical protein [Treponema sp.]